MGKSITKQELKYIVIAVGFALVWFVAIVPNLIKFGVEDSSPYLQFLIFNIGIFIFLQIFLKARTLSRSINIGGTLGVIALIMAVDVLIPPLMVDVSGNLLNGPILSASGSDYIFGYLAHNIGLEGIFVFLFTYVLAPAILLLIAAHFLPNFVKEL